MRKVLGIILIVVGVIALVGALASPSGAEAFGAVIGVAALTFLPAYFLLRKGKRNQKQEEN